MAKFTGSLVKYPARASFLWYVGMTAVGTLLLAMPFSHATDQKITPLEAAFTLTSAACVTGLAVRSTERDFSLAGQIIILILLQLGGIGIMTVTTFIVMQMGSQASLRHRLVIAETLGGDDRQDLRWILRNVFLLTLICEFTGFVLLAIRGWMLDPHPRVIWQALFHAVSAFCNAGFSLHDTSLTQFQNDYWINGVVGALIVLGGLGFPVMMDLRRNWHGALGSRWSRLHIHSKLMLIGTAGLIPLGAVSILALEWDGLLADLPLASRPLAAIFHSISCRTAGFNTINMGDLSDASLFVSILLMIIGAGACSTGGGSKVLTMMVMLLHAWSVFAGRANIVAFRRTIPRETVARAIATLMLFGAIVIVSLLVMLVAEDDSWHQVRVGSHDRQASFVDLVFETVSALGTVGLSTGITAKLGGVSHWVIIALMFIGRLGPISVFAAPSRTERKDSVAYPNEEPMIG